MKKNKISVMTEVNRILGISDSYKAPETILAIILQNDKKTWEMYHSFMSLFNHDLTYDWFFKYFQEEHADRRNNKQDFTPPCLGALTSEMLGVNRGVIFEPTAGTGGMIIKDWDRRRRKKLPWTFEPMDVWYIAEELSEKTIPFLLANLAIRGINANVIHCNGLTREGFAAYEVLNVNNDPMAFSCIYKLPNNKLCADAFNVRFANEAN